MDVAFSSWFVILLAAAAANLPFLNERLFAIVPLRRFGGVKPFWLRLLELAVFYFVVGAIARLLEGKIGKVYPQNWEFYAISACLFIVFAYPGFVYRYLRKRHG